MKKFGVLLLAVVMVAGLVACSSGGDDGPPYEDYTGVWRSTFITRTGSVGSMLLVIHDNGTINLSVNTDRGGSIVPLVNTTVAWDGNGFLYAYAGEYLRVDFSNKREAAFTLDWKLNWTPCTGRLVKQ